MIRSNKSSKILLSFDIEEFDLPIEFGYQIPFEQQIKFTSQGVLQVLSLLKEQGIHATFFCTACFVEHAPEILHKIVADGHEIASHGYYHSRFDDKDYVDSRQKIEQISGVKVSGFRMPRMHKVDFQLLKDAGYTYDSSLNPTFIPGRYNHLNKSRVIYKKPNGIIECPSAVTPLLRIPLFWLSFHNLALWLYCCLFDRTLRHDGYAILYFHPWEFTDLKQAAKFGFPSYVSKNSGEAFIDRIKDFISWAQSNNYEFMRTGDFAENIIKQKEPSAN